MLTLEKLREYRAFDGDIDGWARSLRGGKASTMTDDDWFLIEELRLGLSLVAEGRASSEFSTSLNQRLFALIADEPTRQALREFVANGRD